VFRDRLAPKGDRFAAAAAATSHQASAKAD
jgi:hypothetical protein